MQWCNIRLFKFNLKKMAMALGVLLAVSSLYADGGLDNTHNIVLSYHSYGEQAAVLEQMCVASDRVVEAVSDIFETSGYAVGAENALLTAAQAHLLFPVSTANYTVSTSSLPITIDFDRAHPSGGTYLLNGFTISLTLAISGGPSVWKLDITNASSPYDINTMPSALLTLVSDQCQASLTPVTKSYFYP
jgi:hypothetical protein